TRLRTDSGKQAGRSAGRASGRWAWGWALPLRPVPPAPAGEGSLSPPAGKAHTPFGARSPVAAVSGQGAGVVRGGRGGGGGGVGESLPVFSQARPALPHRAAARMPLAPRVPARHRPPAQTSSPTRRLRSARSPFPRTGRVAGRARRPPPPVARRRRPAFPVAL